MYKHSPGYGSKLCSYTSNSSCIHVVVVVFVVVVDTFVNVVTKTRLHNAAPL